MDSPPGEAMAMPHCSSYSQSQPRYRRTLTDRSLKRLIKPFVCSCPQIPRYVPDPHFAPAQPFPSNVTTAATSPLCPVPPRRDGPAGYRAVWGGRGRKMEEMEDSFRGGTRRTNESWIGVSSPHGRTLSFFFGKNCPGVPMSRYPTYCVVH